MMEKCFVALEKCLAGQHPGQDWDKTPSGIRAVINSLQVGISFLNPPTFKEKPAAILLHRGRQHAQVLTDHLTSSHVVTHHHTSSHITTTPSANSSQHSQPSKAVWLVLSSFLPGRVWLEICCGLELGALWNTAHKDANLMIRARSHSIKKNQQHTRSCYYPC